MSPLLILIDNLRYVVLLAITIQIALLYNRQQQLQDPVFSNETLSAIGRAKTETCKEELRKFASKFLTSDDIFPQFLKRSCPLDTLQSKNERLGCTSFDSIASDLVQIDESDRSTCLEKCFSYGHKYAGFLSASGRCYCGSAENPLETASGDETICDSLELFRVNDKIAQLQFARSQQRPVPSSNSSTKRTTNVKIAFLLTLNGRSAIQIRRLLKNVYSPDHLYYLHVDKREQFLFESLLPLEYKYDNIILARHRFNAIWGGTSLLHMMIDAMSRIKHIHWDYLINLSESDFPIKSLRRLEKFLRLNNGAIFLRSHNMNGYVYIKKQGLNWNFYQCDNRLWRLGKRQLPGGIIYSGGSDWFALPKDYCDFIVEHSNDEHDLVRPLLQLFNFTLLPAESFFHTLALNSKFCDRFVNDNLRLTNWQRKQGCKCQHKDVVDWCGCSPLVYRWADLNRLLATNRSESLFFSRKFDPTISSSIISAVEARLVHADDDSTARAKNQHYYDTRYWLNVQYDPTDWSVPNFARLALQQVTGKSGAGKLFQLQEDSVYLYFNRDRFIGLLVAFCAPANKSSCLQLLVERDLNAHLKNVNQQSCFDKNHQLSLLEVNHNFDTSERLFRNYLPLSSKLELAVYHEWLAQDSVVSSEGARARKIRFNWIKPSGIRVLTQNAKLKATPKLTRLSLAHRMDIRQDEVVPGVWTMSVTSNDETCLEYKFLVFNSSSQQTDTTAKERMQFDSFYSVREVCKSGDCDDADHCRKIETCDTQHEWTLTAMKTFSDLYGLI